jgi:hypothetical protein
MAIANASRTYALNGSSTNSTHPHCRDRVLVCMARNPF